MRRTARAAGIVVAGLPTPLLLSFAILIQTWCTGEFPAPPTTTTVAGGPPIDMRRRIWIDTECGVWS